MKSFKKAVLLTLALAMLVSVISLPASAVVDVTGSKYDQGYTDDFEWNAVLKAEPTLASAALTVTLDLNGSVPGRISAEIRGNGVYDDNVHFALSGEDTKNGVNELTVNASHYVTDNLNSLSCDYLIYNVRYTTLSI